MYVRLQVMKNKSKFGLAKHLDYDESIDPVMDWIISMIKHCCFVPYFVENWVMIVDCDEMGIMSFPVKFFIRLLKLMQLNHAACMHRLFIVNVPFTFNSIWSMAKRSYI